MTERISTLFQPQVLNWNCIQFNHSIAALKPFNSGNVMKVIKTLMNAWTTSSRMGGAHYIYPCLFRGWCFCGAVTTDSVLRPFFVGGWLNRSPTHWEWASWEKGACCTRACRCTATGNFHFMRHQRVHWPHSHSAYFSTASTINHVPRHRPRWV